MEKKKEKRPAKMQVKNVKIKGSEEIKSDVNGSYTGVPTDGSEKPIQDADDL